MSSHVPKPAEPRAGARPHPSSGRLAGLTPFVYGTTRLGDGSLPFAERVAMARRAMDAGVWLHTSAAYGDALAVLGAAFREDPERVPKTIVKIGHDDLAELRASIKRQIAPLGVDHIDLGQLCLGGALAEEFRRGGPCYEGLRQLREEGLVRGFVLEVFPWTSAGPLEALRAGYPEGIVDGCIFYLNPLQRFASNALWQLLIERQVPIIAMRTVAGGDVHRLRDVPGAAWKEYLQHRASEVAPIYERSGVRSWVEFCVRFAHGFPSVRASVGATARPEGFDAFSRASSGRIEPLPNDIQEQIVALQHRWSDETDVHAEPWTM
ncbi:MAG TPA: aldo/keto reductase [Polyangiaceae bacterium]|nr:aldo/keto reductase [Polyangiaceae bacterium]